MTAPWPCSTCNAPGVKNLGALGYCAAHLCDVYRRFDPAVWDGQGIGLQAGPRRPDHGPEFAELECSACGASWVGALFERCGWCARRLELQQEHQAALLLSPELPDVDDIRYDGAVRGWAERLARAVKSELITEQQAHSAWRKAVGDEHHAA